MEYGLWYPKSQDFILKEFTDADWVGSVDDRKSTSRETFFLGSCFVCWSSKKQSFMSLSKVEANTLLLRHVALKSFG